MILKIRKSRWSKATSLFLAAVMLLTTFQSTPSYALTGGPAQPEFNSFTPIGTSDMVDLASGDFSYNIPLMDIGGFPINLAYSSGVTMDQEASWVGLGWDLSIGQINRQMRGMPDDFDGDAVQYENNIKDNVTIGTSFSINPALFGADGALAELIPDDPNLSVDIGIGVEYNSYNGVSITPSLGLTYDIAGCLSVGMNVESGPDGLSVSPNASLHSNKKNSNSRDYSLGTSVGVSFNSRKGLSNLTLNASVSTTAKACREATHMKSGGSQSVGGAVSYVDNTYTPLVQNGLDNESFTFNAAVGGELFGGEGQGQVRAYYTAQRMNEGEKNKTVDVFGYDNTHHAGKDDIRDFNREKDGNFSVNTTNLPLTNYTYDIYSVQGQGVSGMFRPYRSQVGFVRDNESIGIGSGGSFGAEVGLGNAVHVGVDVKTTSSYSKSGDWITNNSAHDLFEPTGNDDYSYEEVYYKNVGDLSVDEESDMFANMTKLGDKQPIRLQLGGTDYNRTVQGRYEIKNPSAPSDFSSYPIPSDGYKRDQRVRRNQNVQKLTVAEVSDANGDGLTIPGFTVNTNAEPHHTAGFIVTRNDGARYVYGQALYNTTKQEVTFAAEGLTPNCSSGQVTYTANVDNSTANTRGDYYFNRVTTPDYAHTYLLTALLSTDYSDLTNNGLTDDDLGSYTKFSYRNPGSLYEWRVPYDLNSANYSEGLRTDPDDDKGSYIYGAKELQYIQKIETKTHVALFYISERHDAHGVLNDNGGKDNNANMYKLDKISLYAKGELYDDLGNIVNAGVDGCGNITTTAIPIKTVHFEYDYSLCTGIPNNDNLTTNCYGTADVNQGGKLTLKKVYFTYRESNMGKYSPYEFTYADPDHDGDTDAGYNPSYDLKSYDVWGYYKPSNGLCDVKDAPNAPEFPYVEQESTVLDMYASAWSLTDIQLPSGGNIQVDYESDDYRSVQNKQTMRMYKVAGAGPVANPSLPGNSTYMPDPVDDDGTLYKTGIGHFQSEYLYIALPGYFPTSATSSDLWNGLLSGLYSNGHNRLVQFRFFMNTTEPGGTTSSTGWENEDFDYVSGYFKLGSALPTLFNDGSNYYVSIPMTLVDMEGGIGSGTNVNPISKAGWHFARKYLNRYAYGAPGVDEGGSAEGIIYQLTGASILNNLIETFQGPNGALKQNNIARRFIKDKSWIRLMDPTQQKKGGGVRVQQLVMTDEWAQMNAAEEAVTNPDPRDQEYGQVYSYDLPSGISSGVATYEPVGCKENPFVQPVYVSENRLLAPDEENYIEKPFGESFFPSPMVTYGRVTVKNIERIESPTREVRKHATGEVVTEFYTSADYPTLTDQTEIQVEEDDNQFLQSLLNINVKKHITLTQGYVVHLNDMNGKMKSQRVYAEGQEDYISGVDYIYDGFTTVDPLDPEVLVSNNTGKLNNKVLALYPNGVLDERVLGVEYDVINDFREMASETETVGVNTNVASFFVGIIPGIVPIPFPDYAHHEDKLNMVSTTKVINTFGILRETVAHDVGASVSTRNLVWDAYTGEVLLTETTNEYGDKYYSFNFPAHWNYSGMGMACHNSGIELPFLPHSYVTNGYKLPGGILGPNAYLHEADEVLVTTGSGVQRAWVSEATPTYFRLIDANNASVAVTGTNSLKVIRSGRRNIQSTSMASLVSMINPLDEMDDVYDYNGNGYVDKKIPSDFYEGAQKEVVNAGAVEFASEWARQCECGFELGSTNVNPYLHNMKGIWRAKRSHLYLTGRTTTNATNPDPRDDGFYTTFSPFYQISTAGKWGIVSTDWTSTSQVTQFNNQGFEIENQDALLRYSAAQYGYNFTFPMAVGANSGYRELAYDGFEDYDYNACSTNEHFGFRDEISAPNVVISETKSHTGRASLAVTQMMSVVKVIHLGCGSAQP